MPAYYVTVNGIEHQVTIKSDGTVEHNGMPVNIDFQVAGGGTHSLLLDAASVKTILHGNNGEYTIFANGHQLEVTVESERTRLLKKYDHVGRSGHRKTEIHAPMPALVVKIEVSVGDEVEPGQGLIILEAMKMENEIKAHDRGKVKEIRVTKGTAVEKGELLMLLE